jgi:predicted nucleic acid-binding protein
VSLIVSDTTPLNYLILIGETGVLPRLFGRLLIPPAVHREMLHPKAPDPVMAWARQLPAWVEVRSPKAPLTLNLGAGESEAIALAVEMPDVALLIDDQRARKAAESRGILAIGTLAVLELADETGLLEFESAWARLRVTTFRVEDEIVDAVRLRIRRRREK